MGLDNLPSPRRRRRCQALSSPARLPSTPTKQFSPTDSGYGSSPRSSTVSLEKSTDSGNRLTRDVEPWADRTTPLSSPSPSCRPRLADRLVNLQSLADGTWSSERDDPFVERHDGKSNPHAEAEGPAQLELSIIPGQVRKTVRQKSATLPRRGPVRCRLALPSAFIPESGVKFRRRASDTQRPHAVDTSTLRVPDRFVPRRTHSTDAAEQFKTGKAPSELTPSEKLLRHNSATEDAFCYRRRVVTPVRARSVAEFPMRASRATVLGSLDNNTGSERQISFGSPWAIGGVAPSSGAVNNGRGQFVRSGTNATLFRTSFPPSKPRVAEDQEKHEARLASALGLDRTQRIFGQNVIPRLPEKPLGDPCLMPTQWNGTEWVKDGPPPKPRRQFETRTLPAGPFKVLDAPNLRDDFYCSILAYSRTCQTLAVGLGDFLYGWSESGGVKLLNSGMQDEAHLTSIAFSSDAGGKAILAFGRSNCTLGLMSLLDASERNSRQTYLARFEVVQRTPITCVSWKPTSTERPTKSRMDPNRSVSNEDLLVRDETGHVYYYAVEWPDRWEVERQNWAGQMTLLARISIHSQQICGISWSRNGALFATGGNDNLCCLFDTDRVTGVARSQTNRSEHISVSEHAASVSEPAPGPSSREVSEADDGTLIHTVRATASNVRNLKLGDEKYRWVHDAAVKAIAFCPWQDGLVATGGGSNDKCIHFFHTTSGAPLATISVSAQVTSLIWSTTSREIVATFGYAQPDHPVRIAVFSWPECRQVAAVPWTGEHRALYAIPYPGEMTRDPAEKEASGNAPCSGGDDTGSGRRRAARMRDRAREGRASTGERERAGGSMVDRRARSNNIINSIIRSRRRGHKSDSLMGGCIMVASSDKSVKFHEVWSTTGRATAGGVGMLGGSDILESLEGIDKEGDVIR